MLDINRQLVDRWDACVGGDRSTLRRSAEARHGHVGLAGFGARFESYDYDGLAPIPQSFTTR